MLPPAHEHGMSVGGVQSLRLGFCLLEVALKSTKNQSYVGPLKMSQHVKGAEKVSFSDVVVHKGVFGECVLSSASLKSVLKL